MPLHLPVLVRSVARASRRAIVIAVAGGAFLLAGSSVAFAHVTVSPPTATAGSYATLTFKVPTESADASTIGLTVTLPKDHPIPSVSARTMPGWTVDMTNVTLDPPVTEGRFTLDHAVHTVTWTADDGSGIKPGQFAEFALSVGPLPDAGRLVFPATQTYSDGTVVKWDEVADDEGSEPEHPAPTVTVSGDAGAAEAGAGDGDGTSASGTDTTAQVLGLAALILAAIALAVAVAGTRRRSSPAGARSGAGAPAGPDGPAPGASGDPDVPAPGASADPDIPAPGASAGRGASASGDPATGASADPDIPAPGASAGPRGPAASEAARAPESREVPGTREVPEESADDRTDRDPA